MSWPSLIAVQAAHETLTGHGRSLAAAKLGQTEEVREALLAAHDPRLGLERSVRLRDVVEALRTADESVDPYGFAGEFIEREFGSG